MSAVRLPKTEVVIFQPYRNVVCGLFDFADIGT